MCAAYCDSHSLHTKIQVTGCCFPSFFVAENTRGHNVRCKCKTLLVVHYDWWPQYKFVTQVISEWSLTVEGNLTILQQVHQLGCVKVTVSFCVSYLAALGLWEATPCYILPCLDISCRATLVTLFQYDVHFHGSSLPLGYYFSQNARTTAAETSSLHVAGWPSQFKSKSFEELDTIGQLYWNDNSSNTIVQLQY